jgi:Zn finger protein HypA/HybF involved in hydrogenase expression
MVIKCDLLNKLKGWLFGRCPKCNSTNLDFPKGWAQFTCRDCHTTTHYGF